MDGIMALNIADMVDGFNLGEDMCNILKLNGFQLIDKYQSKYLAVSGNGKYI